jgi:TRAP-type C4-dicarboxylate transport system permease large subunit
VLIVVEVGLITPPVGLNIFVIKSALGERVALPTIFKGVTWFIGMDVVTLVLLIAFPAITLWLPELIYG